MTLPALPDAQTRRIIAGWLGMLAKVTRHRQGKLSGEELAAVKDERAVYAELLARDFPSGAFTMDSLHATAQGHAFYPSYEEIRARVQEWWNAHRPPAVPRIAGPEGAHLSPGDAAWLDFHRRRRAELLGQPGSMDLPDPHRDPEGYAASDLGRLDSLVRRHGPRAWAVITGGDQKVEPADPEAVQAICARLRASLLQP